jgi:hypothetical protein
MLIIPNTTGLPLAGLGVPREADPPAPPDPLELEVALLVAALLVVAAPPELELELEELPQAVNPTATTAHRLLSFAFISPSLLSLRTCRGPENCAPDKRTGVRAVAASLHRSSRCMQLAPTDPLC